MSSLSADPFAALEQEAARQANVEAATRALASARARLILGREAASAFFATLVLRLVPKFDESMPTLATDGRVLAVNPTFVAGLNPDELVGCLAHEVLHCALAHPARRGFRDLDNWNIACDLAVNPLLTAAGFTLPANRLMPGEGSYAALPSGKSADEYYGLLGDHPSPGDEPTPDGNRDPGGCGGVIDPESPADAADMEADWRVAVTQAEQAAQGRGALPAGLGRVVEDVRHPPADWRSVLREFVARSAKNDYSWSRPNRRFIAQGLYLPGLASDELGDVVVALDTSGSIGARELGVFAAEVEAVLAAYDCTVTLLYHDTEVQRVETWQTSDGPLVLNPLGGGGTSHVCVFDWLTQSGLDPACTICLTDLDTTFPTVVPDTPVLWAVVGSNSKEPPFGRRVSLGG